MNALINTNINLLKRNFFLNEKNLLLKRNFSKIISNLNLINENLFSLRNSNKTNSINYGPINYDMKYNLRFYSTDNKNSNKKEEKEKKTQKSLNVQLIPAGLLQVNCAIINEKNSSEALIVDPGGDYELIMNILKESKLNLKSILLTHAHFDHVLAVGQLRKNNDCKIYLHKEDMYIWNNLKEQMKLFGLKYKDEYKLPEKPDVFINEGDEIKLNNKSVAKVLHTPGHSKGSISFYFEKENFAIVGDTIFKESIGRSDLWGGNGQQLRDAIKAKLYTLPDETNIIPGHGPVTTIGYEKVENFNVF